MPRQAVPRSALEKGGAIAGVSAVLSELVDQLPQGAASQAELLGNVLRRAPFDKHGAEHFVVAVIRIGRSSEKVLARGVIHDPNSPRMSVGFFGRTGLNGKAEWQHRRYELPQNRVKIDSAASRTTHEVTPEPGVWNRKSTENRLTARTQKHAKTVLRASNCQSISPPRKSAFNVQKKPKDHIV
jgi:hypothetical protein